MDRILGLVIAVGFGALGMYVFMQRKPLVVIEKDHSETNGRMHVIPKTESKVQASSF